MAKDYKANSSYSTSTAAPVGNMLGGFLPYLIVLIIGIIIGLINPFQSSHKSKKGVSDSLPTQQESQNLEESASAAPVVESNEVQVVTPKFDFYELLPEMEVEVQDNLKEQPSLPAVVENQEQLPASIEQPVEVQEKTEVAIEKNTPVKAESNYRLQVGAFKTRAEAEQLKAQLAFLGLESFIEPAKQASGAFLHKLKLGPYRSAKDREKVATTLRQHGFSAIPVS